MPGNTLHDPHVITDIILSVYKQLREEFKGDLAELIQKEVASAVNKNLKGINDLLSNLAGHVDNHSDRLDDIPRQIDV